MTIVGPDGLLSFLEEKTIDARLNVRGSISSPTKVAYVNVDTDAIVALGNFPWNREVFAKAINALFERDRFVPSESILSSDRPASPNSAAQRPKPEVWPWEKAF